MKTFKVVGGAPVFLGLASEQLVVHVDALLSEGL